MTLSTGTQLGPYEIVSPLGAGGMGEVYRARDTRLDRDVAVKVLPNRLARDANALRRFQREAKALAALSHPNILSVYDVGEAESTSYVVLELLEGDTLGERIKSTRLDWRRSVEIVASIADGLAAAHAKGIVHRDLKPENIFLTRDGIPRILDFGLATSSQAVQVGSDGVTKTLEPTGTVAGTPAYMSPEQIRGEKATEQSDIFSLGCVLFELLAGRRPFGGKTAAETMAAVLHDSPPDLAECQPGIRRDLEKLVQRCLEKHADDRFHSARDLAYSLRSIIEGRGQASSEFVDQDETPSIAVLPFLNLSADPENEYFSDGITEEIINALARVEGLRVAARTSAFSFKGKQLDVSEVGRKLNVRTILEGSVRKAGNRLRITTQLINVSDGYNLWSERFDRELDDVFVVQDEIAGAIVDRLKITLHPKSLGVFVKPPTRNLEAYDVYLKGRSTWQRFGTGLYLAIDCFERAVALDPDFALAHAGIADTYALLGITAALPPREAMPKAKAAAKRALELDDGLAEAHCALASVYLYYEWDWSLAEKSFLRSLKLNPNYVQAMFHYGHMYLAFVSQELDKGIQLCRRAVEIDPLAAYALHGWLANLYIVGKSAEAIGPLCEVLERDPSAFNLRRLLGLCYLEQSMIEEARNAIETAVITSGRHPWTLYELGMLYVKLGKIPEAEAIQAEIVARSQSSYIPATTRAIIPATLGRFDEAFAHLNCAVDERDGVILTITNWPPLRPLRVDSRYDEILKRLGLENPPQGRLVASGNE